MIVTIYHKDGNQKVYKGVALTYYREPFFVVKLENGRRWRVPLANIQDICDDPDENTGKSG